MFPPFFGPISSRLKAGDLAPELTFGKLLHSPVGRAWTSANFAGHFTLLNFCPNTTANPAPVARWNAMVQQFAAQPVHFLWITAEDESALLPWLTLNPVDGWVLQDSTHRAARSFGLETPQSVIVGPNCRILGYDHLQCSEQTVRAAVEGRTTTIRPKPGLAAIKEFAAADRVLLQAEPTIRPQPGDHRPKFQPSYRLHVSPSQHDSAAGNFSGPDFRSRMGYSVGAFMADAYATSPSHLDLPAGFDDGRRYDFALVLPKPASRGEMSHRLQEAVQDHYGLTVTRENRALDTYVMTVPEGTELVVKPRLKDGVLNYGISFSFRTSTVIMAGDSEPERLFDAPAPLSDVGSISMNNATIDDLCHCLETHLDRPLIDETNIKGSFDFQVKDAAAGDFIQRLRDQLGLVVTVAPRSVEMLVFRR